MGTTENSHVGAGDAHQSSLLDAVEGRVQEGHRRSVRIKVHHGESLLPGDRRIVHIHEEAMVSQQEDEGR